MKVIVDNKIPYIKAAIEALADEVVYLPGQSFTPQVVKEADALLIRTRTRCDRSLLEGSRVRFIGTATIGFDHIDTDYCRTAGIAWSNCPGCNAGAVEQYLHSVLLLLQREKEVDLRQSCLGVVGVGHVGSRVAAMAERLGLRVLRNDPPRADRGEPGFVPLETLAAECNLLSFHTPLIREGKYCTFHLADASFLRSLRQQPYLINTARGEVADTAALLSARKQDNWPVPSSMSGKTSRTSTGNCWTRCSSAPPTSPAILPTARPMPPAWCCRHSAGISGNGPTFPSNRPNCLMPLTTNGPTSASSSSTTPTGTVTPSAHGLTCSNSYGAITPSEGKAEADSGFSPSFAVSCYQKGPF